MLNTTSLSFSGSNETQLWGNYQCVPSVLKMRQHSNIMYWPTLTFVDPSICTPVGQSRIDNLKGNWNTHKIILSRPFVSLPKDLLKKFSCLSLGFFTIFFGSMTFHFCFGNNWSNICFLLYRVTLTPILMKEYQLPFFRNMYRAFELAWIAI